jgi:hypothetical protein
MEIRPYLQHLTSSEDLVTTYEAKRAGFVALALEKSFAEDTKSPYLFFIGAAIEKEMANEIWTQLNNGTLANAANLTQEAQVAAICLWLCRL